eukprot:m.20083 g.20083  ORF g.20083 m.20083 type:complete len:374 (-) comp10118_c0_seq1:31-1152(-)
MVGVRMASVLVMVVGVGAANPTQCAPRIVNGSRSYLYQPCGNTTSTCPADLICTQLPLNSTCGLPRSCTCSPTTGATSGQCTRDCSGSTSLCLPRACGGTVTTYTGQACASTVVSTTATGGVCSPLTVHAQNNTNRTAYVFTLSSGGVCWSSNQSTCMAMATNVTDILGLSATNMGMIGSTARGCAMNVSAVMNSSCFTGNGTNESFHVVANCPSFAPTIAPTPSPSSTNGTAAPTPSTPSPTQLPTTNSNSTNATAAPTPVPTHLPNNNTTGNNSTKKSGGDKTIIIEAGAGGAALVLLIIAAVLCRCCICRKGSKKKHQKFDNLAFDKRSTGKFDRAHPTFGGFSDRGKSTYALEPNDYDSSGQYDDDAVA